MNSVPLDIQSNPRSPGKSKKRRSSVRTSSICRKVECVVCMDHFTDPDCNGVRCTDDHFLCSSDLSSYLTENVFPQVFKLRDNRCAISCPSVGCSSEFNALQVYKHLSAKDRLRYQSMIHELVLYQDKDLKVQYSTLLDIMTLKCPTCKTPVDPFPDACSAVMCLNCGNHYCNYCFEGFATGKSDRDRAAAHEHTAGHHESDKHGGRDAFLPAETVARGHREYRLNQLSRCVLIAMTSTEFGVRGRHDVALSLILCAKEIEDLGLDIHDVWEVADGRYRMAIQGDVGSPDSSLSCSKTVTTSEFDEIDTAVKRKVEIQKPAYDRIHPTQLRGGQQLANAILTNNSSAVVQLVESYRDELDIDYVDTRHGHPLTTLAILSGQVWAAKLLLERGADPLKVNKGGRTVLYIAIEAGLEDIVRLVFQLRPDIDVNVPTTDELQRYCPIHVAARNNHGALIPTLVELGTNLDLEESEHGYTPLMLALVLGHEWVASELILAGANVRYLASNGRSPMFVAAEKGLSSIISLMVTHCGISVNEPAVRPSGLRMIHVAAFHKQPVIVSQLVRLGANVNQFDDENGYSPLSMAILGLNSAAALDLIKAGADITQPSRSGRTPLYVAVEKGLTDIVRALLAMPDVDINAPVTSERNAARPLHVAILYGQSQLIPLLISLGADVNLPDDERKCSPLLMATLLKDAWSVQLLLRANANPCQLSKEGRSALYIAAEKGFSGILRLLIEESNVVDINGPVTSESHRGTALHIAAMFDNAHTIIELISLGVDVNAADSLGRKAIDIAREMSSTRAEIVLTRYSNFPWPKCNPRLKAREMPNQTKYNPVFKLQQENEKSTAASHLNKMPEIQIDDQPTFSIGSKGSGRKRGQQAHTLTAAGPPSPGDNSLAASTPLPRRSVNDNPRKSQSDMNRLDSTTNEVTLPPERTRAARKA